MLKNLKLSFIISSILYMALGIVLLLWKDTTLNIICYAFGGITLFYGFSRLTSYLGTRENSSVLQADNFIGILMIGLGIFLLMNRSIIESILPIVLGLFVIFNSIIKLQYAFELKGVFYEKWWILLFLGITTAVLGAVVCINKFPTPDISLLVMGAVLVADGLSNIFTVAFASFIQWKMKRSTTDLAVVGVNAETVMEDAEIRVSEIQTGVEETLFSKESVVMEEVLPLEDSAITDNSEIIVEPAFVQTETMESATANPDTSKSSFIFETSDTNSQVTKEHVD